MVKILILVDEFPRTSETFILDHVVGLATGGYQVHVAAKYIDEARLHELVGTVAESIKLFSLRTRSNKSLNSRLRRLLWLGRWPSLIINRGARKAAAKADWVREVITVVRPALVHAHFGPMGLAAALAIGRRNIPLVVDFHGYDALRFPAQNGWEVYRKILGGSQRKCAIVHSPFMQSILDSRIGMKLAYVNHGVDLSRFSPGGKNADWAGELRLLSVGRVERLKGHDVVVSAAAKLLEDRFISLKLKIVGDGSGMQGLKQDIARLALQEHVELAGAMTPAEVAYEMQQADMLVMASQISADGWQEAFGRVAIEAMAVGIPVVGTPSGNLPATISDAGVVADGFDAAAIAAAILRVVAADSPKGWCDRARARANRFSIDRMHQEYAEVTSRMLNQAAADS